VRLLPVELHLRLGIVRIEGGEQIGELGALARLGQEGAGLGPELLDAQRAAPVLEQEVEAGRGAEACDRGDVEGEDDRLRDRRELRDEVSNDPLHVQGLAVALPSP
jgi:hypothetical protein